jgi:hypothetical protein
MTCRKATVYSKESVILVRLGGGLARTTNVRLAGWVFGRDDTDIVVVIVVVVIVAVLL